MRPCVSRCRPTPHSCLIPDQGLSRWSGRPNARTSTVEVAHKYVKLRTWSFFQYVKLHWDLPHTSPDSHVRVSHPHSTLVSFPQNQILAKILALLISICLSPCQQEKRQQAHVAPPVVRLIRLFARRCFRKRELRLRHTVRNFLGKMFGRHQSRL